MLAGRQNHNWNLNNCPVLSGVGEEVARPPSPEGYTRSSVCSSTASPSDWLLGMLSNAFLLKNHHFLPMSARQLISVISTLTADTHSCRHWGDKDPLEGLVSISITWKHLGKHIFDCRLYLLHSHRSVEIADFGFPFEESFLQVLKHLYYTILPILAKSQGHYLFFLEEVLRSLSDFDFLSENLVGPPTSQSY